jgi:hypothetical protein
VYVAILSTECRSKSVHNKIANISFENVSQFKHLGKTGTNKNLIQEEIEFWQCLLPFGPEPFVFLAAVKKLKD